MKKSEMTIEEEQRLQLEILKWFNNLCEQEQLHYFLAYGTLLGCVREQGFIEWDDDIDLWMPRADVEKLETVFEDYNNGRYFLQTEKTDLHSVSPEMVRICVNGTYKWPDGCENERFHVGLYFDIFPLDNAFGDKRDFFDIEQTRNYHRQLYKTLHLSRRGIKGKVRGLLNRLISRKKYRNLILKIIENHRSAQSNYYLSFGAVFRGKDSCYFAQHYFESSRLALFEGLSVPIPLDSDSLLKQLYGDDYMIPKVMKTNRTRAFYV